MFHEGISGVATGRPPGSVASCPGSGLCGEGVSRYRPARDEGTGGPGPPPRRPHPRGDSHHGPQHGVKRGNGVFSCVQPLALPHEFSHVAFRVSLQYREGILPHALSRGSSRSLYLRIVTPSFAHFSVR
ncbi:hypothetical protein BN140_3048 [Methanoculleus bourgensis MS2]|uniref:Uncharacterized protein n=1 Tax=Methanoculleus bourgensis (strain ATCC 43281 / DSM 3045 / OCM 15 / MS2) TaxID=1201294 RepID=W6Q8S6_METBM|nr:hypothetical protein BN140_3048 [Methanoculleus bourgensis MS2]